MIAAIYARKSTEQPGVADDQKSVARQVDHARQYAARKGWTVGEHVYVDDGISGAEFVNRPGFLRLMNALKPRAPFQVLVMSEESRLGREAIETAYALKQLVQAGVRVFFYLEDRERTLDSPTDKIMLSLTAFADELEREKARQRTYDALLRKARAGDVTGGRVFGYENIRRDTGGVRRVILDGEAAVVRRIFELAATGHGFTTIAKILNADRAVCPRPQQNRPAGWAPSSVREILNRPLYRGEIIWNQSRKRDRWGVQHQQPRPDQEWIRVPAPDLAIVSDALWRAAHTQMARQRERYSRTSAHGAPPWSINGRYLLTGLLRCGVCGGGLEARSRPDAAGRSVFYGCAAYHRRGRAVCTNRLTMPMDVADNAVLTAVESGILNGRILAAAVRRAAKRLTDRPDSRQDTRRELATLDGELLNLTRAAAAGGDVPALVDALRERETRRMALLDHLRRAAPMDRDVRAVLADLQDRLVDWRGLLRANTAKARALLKQLILGRLVLEPDYEAGLYRFHGTGTLEPLIQGIAQPLLVPQSVASPRGTASLWIVPLSGEMRRAA